jgi:mono/diheme cytochrome c family protein
MVRPATRLALTVLSLLAAFAAAGCRRDMQDTPRYEPYESSTFFKDGRASRHLVAGTIARGQLQQDTARATGKTTTGYVTALAMPLSRQVLDRGHQRFDIYCSPCHDRVGTGGGMIVQRGYKPPPSLHEDRLRAMPLGYFFDVMTNGFGVMPGYAPQVSGDDRWAIAAYIRALQLAQHARRTTPAEERAKLDTVEPLPPPGSSGTGGRENVQPPIGGAPTHEAPQEGEAHGAS